ncbi:RRXRR domain-containing protein [Nocardiopsis kunsanensis]|uniref:RRXRR domain-containing protein n=1 Tax=Nocardiopsis kunsanensis TaxID=141693 RepID=UPI0003457AB3
MTQLAAFRAGQKTHQAVPPQQLALESESADTPRIGHGTGPGPRPRGWPHPSLEHRVQATTARVSRLTRWAPFTAVHVERVASGTRALSAGTPLEGTEYQQGALAGYEVRECLPAEFDRACVYCGATDTTLNIDHAHPRARGGSDRGSCARTRADKHGFARLRLPRTKGGFGVCTADLVRAVVPEGKKAGTHTGRVAVRASGGSNITTSQGTVQGINRKYVRLLQRADGHAYTWKGEGVFSRP